MNSFDGEVFAIILFFIGFYGVISQKKIVKSIISIGIMETSAVLFILSIGYKAGGIPPIGSGITGAAVVDPLPQAFVITAIIIGVAVTAVNLTMLVSLYKKNRAISWDQAKKGEAG